MALPTLWAFPLDMFENFRRFFKIIHRLNKPLNILPILTPAHLCYLYFFMPCLADIHPALPLGPAASGGVSEYVVKTVAWLRGVLQAGQPPISRLLLNACSFSLGHSKETQTEACLVGSPESDRVSTPTP